MKAKLLKKIRKAFHIKRTDFELILFTKDLKHRYRISHSGFQRQMELWSFLQQYQKYIGINSFDIDVFKETRIIRSNKKDLNR